MTDRETQIRGVNNRIRALKFGQVAILWASDPTGFVVVERMRRKVGIVYFSGDSRGNHETVPLDGFSWPCMVTLTEDESAALIMQQALAPGSIHDACAAKVAACKEDLQ